MTLFITLKEAILDLHRHFDQRNPVHAAGDEAEIRELIENYSAAVREGYLEKIMSYYAEEIVAYDVPPPLEVTSHQEYKDSWAKYFIKVFKFPVQYDNHALEVHVGGDVAFAHEIIHVIGDFKNSGEHVENWLRHTSGFKKLDGQWKIVHDHSSTPVGEDGKALMNLRPTRLPQH